MAITRWRTYGAGAALSAVGALNLTTAATHPHGIRPHSYAFAAIVGVGAFLFGCKSILAQLAARGIAWSLVVPSAAVAFVSLTHGFTPPARLFAAPLLALTALVLARPALDTKEARAAFAPVAFRRLLMAGTTASFAIGIAFGEMASTFLAFRLANVGAVLGILSALLLVSGVGITKMRAWAMLLAMATSALSVGAILSFGNAFVGPPLLIAAIPGLIMAAAIALGRAGFGRPHDVASADLVRVRVADLPRSRFEMGAKEECEVDECEVDDAQFLAASEMRASLLELHAGDEGKCARGSTV